MNPAHLNGKPKILILATLSGGYAGADAVGQTRRTAGKVRLPAVILRYFLAPPGKKGLYRRPRRLMEFQYQPQRPRHPVSGNIVGGGTEAAGYQ